MSTYHVESPALHTSSSIAQVLITTLLLFDFLVWLVQIHQTLSHFQLIYDYFMVKYRAPLVTFGKLKLYYFSNMWGFGVLGVGEIDAGGFECRVDLKCLAVDGDAGFVEAAAAQKGSQI